MAKKQRTVRPPRSADMSRYGGMTSSTPGQPGSVVPAGSPAAASKGTPAAARAAVETDYATEYRYVSGDLRRIALLAGAMFVVLIVLSLVVR